ncbi:MAG: hypothetical protein ACRC33_09695 [Gemmataceae bacterium]
MKHLKPGGGVLINLGTVASDLSIPMQTMYSATEHAIKHQAGVDRHPVPGNATNDLDVEPKPPEPASALRLAGAAERGRAAGVSLPRSSSPIRFPEQGV